MDTVRMRLAALCVEILLLTAGLMFFLPPTVLVLSSYFALLYLSWEVIARRSDKLATGLAWAFPHGNPESQRHWIMPWACALLLVGAGALALGDAPVRLLWQSGNFGEAPDNRYMQSYLSVGLFRNSVEVPPPTELAETHRVLIECGVSYSPVDGLHIGIVFTEGDESRTLDHWLAAPRRGADEEPGRQVEGMILRAGAPSETFYSFRTNDVSITLDQSLYLLIQSPHPIGITTVFFDNYQTGDRVKHAKIFDQPLLTSVVSQAMRQAMPQ
jgi:hypothetical protein